MVNTTFSTHIQSQKILGHFKFGSKTETNKSGRPCPKPCPSNNRQVIVANWPLCLRVMRERIRCKPRLRSWVLRVVVSPPIEWICAVSVSRAALPKESAPRI